MLGDHRGVADVTLGQKWTITRLGPVHHILGMKVQRDRANHKLWITQGGYIDQIVARFPNFSPSTARHSPLPVNPQTDDSRPTSQRQYQELVGSLLWLAGCTRPDIAYAASFLGRYSADPTEAHWQMGLRVISYLSHSRNIGLTLGGKPRSLECYVDSDWGGCKDTRRSTSGLVVYLHGSAVNWSSRRQQTVSASSMEAEYIAAAEATHEVSWFRSLLREIGLQDLVSTATVLHVDNQSAIKLSGNPITHSRAKHIDIKHHIVREQVAAGNIALQYIETAKQRADLLTKPLSGPVHLKQCIFLRLEMPRTGETATRRQSTASDGSMVVSTR